MWIKHTASILILLFSIPFSVFAQSEYKIGFVNTGKVLKQAPQALAVEQRLKASFLEREKILKAKQDELLDLEQQIKTGADTLSTVDQRKLEREFRLKVSQLKFEQQEFREDQNLKRNEEIRLLQQIIAKVLERIGDEQKFDLILTEGVTYVSNKIEITHLVIEELKKEMNNPSTENQ
jgi:outer membrane protein